MNKMIGCPDGVVAAKSAEGFNFTLLQLFGLGPKWTIRCGWCLNHFTKRIQLVNYPTVPCPHCGTSNILNLVVDE